MPKRSPTDSVRRVPPAEQLLISLWPEIEATVEPTPGQAPRVLCTTLGRGQFAAAVKEARPESPVICQCFDIYLADETRSILGGGPKSAQVVCAADLLAGPFDAVVVPVDPRGEAELTREILQAGHEALRHGGRLIAATPRNEDTWLHAEMRKLFPKVTRKLVGNGVVYLSTKDAPLKKTKDFVCEFAFRDQERLIKAVSRPGVFSHRGLDGGARALINSMQIQAGDKVLDLGCGSGVVSLACALRAPAVQVTAVDSHARAISCTIEGAKLNGLSNISTHLNAQGHTDAPGTFQVVLGNPPYYSDFRIAEIFLHAAKAALARRGRVYMVTKNVSWFSDHMEDLFTRVTVHEHKAYAVVEAVKK